MIITLFYYPDWVVFHNKSKDQTNGYTFANCTLYLNGTRHILCTPEEVGRAEFNVVTPTYTTVEFNVR